jgi:hypothetical protein
MTSGLYLLLYCRKQISYYSPCYPHLCCCSFFSDILFQLDDTPKVIDMYLAVEACPEEVVISWKIRRAWSEPLSHLSRTTGLLSRPCYSSFSTQKSSNISVQQSDVTVAAVSWLCPKKRWLVTLKASTAHHTVSFSLCIGHWWSSWQLFCMAMKVLLIAWDMHVCFIIWRQLINSLSSRFSRMCFKKRGVAVSGTRPCVLREYVYVNG